MTVSKFLLPYCEFYITNVCNLNCENCNRFNNFAFTGAWRWEDLKDTYRQWSTRIDIDKIGILGGEPLTNTDFREWLYGLHELWPNSSIVVYTNGTTFDLWPEMKEDAARLGDKLTIKVSNHDAADEVSAQSFKSMTELTNTKFIPIQQQARPGPSGVFRNEHSTTFSNFKAVNFRQSTVIHDQTTSELTLHNSDPVKAVEACQFTMGNHICLHMVGGELFKCGPVALLPMFIKQFNVTMTDEQRALVGLYVSAKHTDSDNDLESFIKSLMKRGAIPQCSLCTESKETHFFTTQIKKPKLDKL
jgi:organic radical activating enzyme